MIFERTLMHSSYTPYSIYLRMVVYIYIHIHIYRKDGYTYIYIHTERIV